MSIIFKQLAVLISSASVALSLVIPAGEELSRSSQAIHEFYKIFNEEISLQETLLDVIGLHLTDTSQITNAQFEEAEEELVDSHLRRTLLRNKIIDYIPVDMVIDTPGVEYLAAVGSRYMDNIIHNVRQLKTQAQQGANALPLELLQQTRNAQRKLKALDTLMFTTADPTLGNFGTDAETSNQVEFDGDTLDIHDEIASATDALEKLSFDNIELTSKVKTIETNETESSVVRTSTTSDYGSTETISETIVDRSVIVRSFSSQFQARTDEK